MKITKLPPLALAVAALSVAACSDSTTEAVSELVSDSVLTADIATSAGDAIASALEIMAANEGAVSLPGVAYAVASPANANALTFSRTRTCYDANDAVVAGCSPLSSVRKIVTHVTADGSRSGTRSTTGGSTVTWSGAVHRVADDTVTRNFNTAQPPVETSRTHSGLSVGHDTTSFSDGTNSREVSEASLDSVKALTWNLPRSSNPFPVSGKIVRVDSVHVVATRGSSTQTRDAVRIIEVTFPADAQGNVVLKIDDKTCTLNLVTHAVSDCQ